MGVDSLAGTCLVAGLLMAGPAEALLLGVDSLAGTYLVEAPLRADLAFLLAVDSLAGTCLVAALLMAGLAEAYPLLEAADSPVGTFPLAVLEAGPYILSHCSSSPTP